MFNHCFREKVLTGFKKTNFIITGTISFILGVSIRGFNFEWQIPLSIFLPTSLILLFILLIFISATRDSVKELVEKDEKIKELVEKNRDIKELIEIEREKNIKELIEKDRNIKELIEKDKEKYLNIIQEENKNITTLSNKETIYFLSSPEVMCISKLSNLKGDYSYLDYTHYIVIQNNSTKEQLKFYRHHTNQEYQVTGGFKSTLERNPTVKNQIGKALTDEIPIFKQTGILNIQIFEKGVMIWEGISEHVWHWPE